MTPPSISSPGQVEQDLSIQEVVAPILKPSNRFNQRTVGTKRRLKVSIRQKDGNKRIKVCSDTAKDDIPKAVRIAVAIVNLLDPDLELKESLQKHKFLLSRISTLSKQIRAWTEGLEDDSWIIYKALLLLLRLKAFKLGQHLGDGLDLFYTAYILSFKILSAGYEERRWNLESWNTITGNKHGADGIAKMDLAMCKNLNWDFGSQTQLLEFRKRIEIDYDKGVEMSIETYL